MATIDVKDAAEAVVAIEKPLTPGRAAAASSRPVTLSTEDKAVLDLVATAALQTAAATLTGAVAETAPATDTASSGLNGRLQRIAQRLTSLIALIPAALGRQAAAASLSISYSTEDRSSLTNIEDASEATSSAVALMSAKLPASIGSKAFAASLATVEAQNTPTDRSGSTSGTPSTATNALSANASRRGFILQNVSTTAGIWMNLTGTATAASGSIYLPPGAAYESPQNMCPVGAISVLSTSASTPYTAMDW